MGLDTSHDAWHGAYSAFTRFRHALAEAAGYEVVKLPGAQFESALIDWAHAEDKNYYGEWDSIASDATRHQCCSCRSSPPFSGTCFCSSENARNRPPSEDEGRFVCRPLGRTVHKTWTFGQSN